MIAQNRNVKTNWEAAVANPRVKLVDIVEPAHDDWVSAVAPAFIAAVFSFFAGVGLAQWAAAENAVVLWFVFNEANQVKASLALGGSLGTVSFIGLYVFTRLAGGVRYYADFSDVEEDVEPPDSLIPTARSHEMKRLTGRMRSLLQTFARRYDEIGTFAIIPWYESKYLNRSQIEDIRKYAVHIGAANIDGRSIVTLSEWGAEQLPKWAVNDFGDVIELTANPPTPEAA